MENGGTEDFFRGKKNGEWRKLHFENIDFFQGERRNGGFFQRKKNGEWHPPKT